MTLSRRLAALAALVVLTALSACGDKPAAESQKVVRIIAGGTDVAGKYVPGGLTGVVAEQGWLKTQLAAKGYSVEFIDMPHAIGGPMINEGFANRSVEFAYYGDLPAVIGASGGAPIRLVLPFKGVTNTYLLVSPGSSARTVADLKGKRIALHRGRPWEAVFARLLESEGLKLGDFKILNVNPSAGAAALAAGKVDAFVGPIADADRLTAQGAGRIIWSTKAAPRSWAQRTELFGRQDFIQRNPEAARLVAAAYIRAADWAAKAENRDAYIRMLSRETPERAIRADLDGTGPWPDRFVPLTQADLVEHYRKVIDHAASTGLIASKPAIEPLIDVSLVGPAAELARAEAVQVADASQAAKAP